MSPVFVSRTPIYDRKLETYGYELRLFGDTREGAINGLVQLAQKFELNRLAGTRPVMIRARLEELHAFESLPWPHAQMVVAVAAESNCGTGTPAAVGSLIERGLGFAIEEPDGLSDRSFADGIRLCTVNASRLDHWLNRAEPKRLPSAPKLLTRGLETARQFEESFKLGFDLFQGEFFEKPRLLRGRDLAANRLQTLQLLARLQDPDISIDEVTMLVKQDLTLSYKLLRMLNSAFFGIPKQVESISRAVVFFGLKRIKNWATVLLVNAADFQPRELLVTAMTRARMCERLASASNRANPDRYYLAGLFSLLDSIMDAPIETILANLGLASEIDEALLSGNGPVGELLKTVLDFERGCVDHQSPVTAEHDALLQQAYLEGLDWAQDTYRHLE